MLRMASLVIPVLLGACAAMGADEEGPACEGKCDDAAAAPLASCWIVPGPEGDPFFTFDELVCSARRHAVYERVTINALGAGNQSGGVFLEGDAPATVLRIPRDTGYPVRVTTQLNATTGLVNSVLPTSLKVQASIAAPAAATAEAPLAWRLPFEVGEVIVDSHLEGGDLTFAYPLDLAPFVDGSGAATITIRKAAALDFGRRTRLELPSSGGRLAATAQGAALELPGFGHYAIGADGVTPVPAPSGAAVIACRATDGTAADARAVACALALPAELATATGTIAVGDGPALALAGDAEVALGEFAPAAFPLTVKVKATLAAAGVTILDRAVEGREIELEVTVPAVAEVSARLPIDLWSVTLTCGEELCMLDRGEFVLPLPSRFQWGERVFEDNVVTLSRDEQATFVFASAAGDRGFAGKQVLIVDGNLVEAPVRVEAGTYRLDRAGLTP